MTTREPQYQCILDAAKEGITPLGLMTNYIWRDNPMRLVFTLARYKFVAKMLAGKAKVMEVGCGDAWASRIVAQSVGMLSVTDFDPIFINDARERKERWWPFVIMQHDWVSSAYEFKLFDAAYALDVIEHIEPDQEQGFIQNIMQCLDDSGILILGCPSLESQIYASEVSKAGHVNCKTGEQLRELMGQFFHNVFLFSMNDEVVHTGFSGMAHYLFAIGATKR
jgi:2-polyprenyl-3-methyl-5-hydroxy-6-metoxy-1,4-benzoquinol methylase